MLIGGFPYVVDAVGYSNTVTDALRLVDNRGTVLLLGAARHSTDPGLDGAPSAHSIARALEILDAGYLPSDAVITHEFPLEAHRDAIATARDRRAGAIKVVFRPTL